MTVHVLRADARTLPLPDESVDLIVTSPPYWSLRSYRDAGEHYAGQVGDEPTPRDYVRHLLDITREWVRVLKPSGSILVNLGDKYAGDTKWGGASDVTRHPDGAVRGRRSSGLPDKSLCLLPERYRIGCVDELGLIARAVIVWGKPNGLPESVGDRVRRAHEDWVHLTKQPRYFAAMDEIREPYAPGTAKRYAAGYKDADYRTGVVRLGNGADYSGEYEQNPLGKLPGSVWDIVAEPLSVPDVSPLDGRPLPKHHAAFPIEWPRRLIAAFSPAGVCVECGEGRRADQVCRCNAPIATPVGRGSPRADDPTLQSGRGGFNRPRAVGEGVRVMTRWEQRHYAKQLRALSFTDRQVLIQQVGATAMEHYVRTDLAGARAIPPHVLQAWLDLGLLTPAPEFVPPPTRPAVVLDPFGGSGTTALVADALGRVGVTVDLSHDYCRLARWRTTDPGERARARRVDKPPVQADGQAELFAMEG